MKNNKIAVLLAIVCTVLWGTAFPFIKLGYSTLKIAENDVGSKLLFAGYRFTLAGIAVFLIVCFISKKFPVISKKDLLPVSTLGLVQTFAQYILSYVGIGFTSSTNTSIITACSSFFSVIAASLFFKSDKLTSMKILGCIIGFAGVITINGVGGFSTDTLLGDTLILASTISAASGNIFSKKLASGRNPFVITAYQLTFGGALLILFGVLFGGKINFSDTKGIAILLWLAFVSAAAFSLWTALLKHHNASKITIFNLLVPIIGTILSGIMLSEDVFRIETFVSLILISMGIVAVNLSGKRRNLK